MSNPAITRPTSFRLRPTCARQVSSQQDNRKLARHKVTGASQNEIMSRKDIGNRQILFRVPSGQVIFFIHSFSRFAAGSFSPSLRGMEQ
jgi:hypothetical protein